MKRGREGERERGREGESEREQEGERKKQKEGEQVEGGIGKTKRRNYTEEGEKKEIEKDLGFCGFICVVLHLGVHLIYMHMYIYIYIYI